MARLGTDVALAPLAARAIAVGIFANTVLKLGVTLLFGSATFRRTASWSLAAMGVALGLGIGIVW